MMFHKLGWLTLMLAVASGCGDDNATGAGGGDSTSSATGSGGSAGSGGSDEVPAVEDPFTSPPAKPPLSEQQLADLKADIDAALSGSSATEQSALIVSLENGQVVYERNPDVARKPASNTKLFTTAALLALSGESHRPAAGIYGAAPQAGVIGGDLVLYAQHDPANSSWFAQNARQALDAAAGELIAAGVTRVGGDVIAKGEFVYEGNSLGYVDYATERAEAAAAMRAALTAAGISVDGQAATSADLSAPSIPKLLTLPSVSADVLAHAINVPSHNEFADLTLHHLGFLDSQTSTYAAGFSAELSVLASLGVPSAGLILHDGSGLSHDNRTTPRHLVDLMAAMSGTAEWPGFLHSMAIAGVRGTVANRMTGPDTNGRFWGKTGTLTGVITLSGALFHKHDGQTYLVSLLLNGVSNSTQARASLDSAVAQLAQNRRGLGAPLAAPTRTLSLGDDRNGQTGVVSWQPVEGATGYTVWRSPDGRSFPLAEARFVPPSVTRFRTFAFGNGETRGGSAGSLFVRITAHNDSGESRPSNVLGMRPSDDGSPLLIVDGNERYVSGPVPENPLGGGHDSIVYHAEATDGPFESAAQALIENGEHSLSNYSQVVWMLGRESTADTSFSGAEQELVAAYVAAGGRLLVSGSEIAYDLIGQGGPADQAFAREVLGIDYVADDAATTLLTRGAMSPTQVSLSRFSRLGRHEISFPDVLSASAGGSSCLRYAGGTGGDACILTNHSSGGRVVALGVPIEGMDDPELARALLGLLAP